MLTASTILKFAALALLEGVNGVNRLATKKNKLRFTDNRQRSKILTDNRQSNEILTDNWHVDPPIQTLLFVIYSIFFELEVVEVDCFSLPQELSIFSRIS